MQKLAELIVTSPPQFENLVVEGWKDGELLFMLTKDEDGNDALIFGNSVSFKLVALSEFQKLISAARSRL